MKNKLCTVLFVLASLPVIAQKNYWRIASESSASKINGGKAFFKNGFQPAAYKLFSLAEDDFAASLQQQQTARSSKETIISVPVANGNIEKFSIRESSVMEQKLQSKFSNIRSYIGQGVDDPSKTIACSYTPLGFHASIMGVDENTMYINPINKKGHLYAVFARNDNDKSDNKLQCATDDIISAEKITANAKTAATNKVAPVGNIDDGKLRTYRLALCTTGEWSLFFMTGSEVTHEDSINIVLSALAIELVRANQVYERDLGIHMNFVDNEDTLIFLNPSTDPFSLFTLNNKCQQTCDSRIGNANYDIGHVLAKGGDNGNAGCIGCVCKTGSKGSGMSTYSKPDLTDYFVIDYWTHEMGHQYGANHTFTYSNEGTSAQIEPGSGSTIMGYAGITGRTDVQPHSNDLFSTASIAQISIYTKPGGGGNACAVTTVTGNRAPNANAGIDRIIPISTPFILTGKGNDADKADAPSYIWEQIDAFESGANKYPGETVVKGPEFRTFNYGSIRKRTFPSDTTILRGANGYKWETLSSVSRDLNFRFTVRDNHVGGGNNKSDDMLVKVVNTAGPFVVTSPNTAVSWVGGTAKTITWNVANTNITPVSCANVKIALSVDGGQTYNIVLKALTPNDGSEVVNIPNVSTTKARVAIFAVDNIFFDISNADFAITTTALTAKEQPKEDLNAAKKQGWITQPNPAKDFFVVTFSAPLKNAVLTLSDNNGKAVYGKSFQSINAGQTEKISLHDFTKGNYFINIASDNGTQMQKLIVE